MRQIQGVEGSTSKSEPGWEQHWTLGEQMMMVMRKMDQEHSRASGRMRWREGDWDATISATG